MIRFSKSLMVMAIGLAFCAAAEANGGKGQNGSRSTRSLSSSSSSKNWNNSRNSGSYNKSFNNYIQKFGTKFEHGYFYSGKYHDHWSHYCWYPSYGCYLYYDPCVYSWYYWCAPAYCYYPVSYVPYGTYAPAENAAPIQGAPAGVPAGQPGDADQEPPQPPGPVTGAGKLINQPQGLANLAPGATTKPTKVAGADSAPAGEAK
jgi:hypothetical protein